MVVFDYPQAKQAVVMNPVAEQDSSRKGLLYLNYPNLPLDLVVVFDYSQAKQAVVMNFVRVPNQ